MLLEQLSRSQGGNFIFGLSAAVFSSGVVIGQILAGGVENVAGGATWGKKIQKEIRSKLAGPPPLGALDVTPRRGTPGGSSHLLGTRFYAVRNEPDTVGEDVSLRRLNRRSGLDGVMGSRRIKIIRSSKL